jgi:hypothetical protein
MIIPVHICVQFADNKKLRISKFCRDGTDNNAKEIWTDSS